MKEALKITRRVQQLTCLDRQKKLVLTYLTYRWISYSIFEIVKPFTAIYRPFLALPSE